MKNVTKVKIGKILVVFLKLLTESNTYFVIALKEMNEKIPASTGDTNQERTINPILSQTTKLQFHHRNSQQKPTIAPIIECVVDTGYLKYVANVNHKADAKSAHNIPNIKAPGSSSKISCDTIFFLTVSMSREPMRTAPANSNTEAIKIACLRVTDLLPTGSKTGAVISTTTPRHYKN